MARAPRLAPRASTFDEVVGGLDASTALFEARRCLSCGNCFACDNCYGVCPDNAVLKLDGGGAYAYAIDLDYCKGCGLCAAECPAGAIAMEPGRSEGLAACVGVGAGVGDLRRKPRSGPSGSRRGGPARPTAAHDGVRPACARASPTSTRTGTTSDAGRISGARGAPARTVRYDDRNRPAILLGGHQSE